MTLSAMPTSLQLPRFSSEMERSFQRGYYVRVRPTLRLVSGALSATIGLYALLGLHQKMGFVGVFNVPQLLLCLLVFGLTWMQFFGRVWQPTIMVASWLAALLMFDSLAAHMIATPPPVSDRFAAEVILRLIFTIQVCVFMVALATFRLTFLPTVGLQCGVVLAATLAFVWHLGFGSSNWHSLLQFFEPVLVVLLAVLLASFIQEKLARGAFEFNHRLSDLQMREHELRLESEKMLHALNGAIGGVVHDLGNPLTTVQTGAEISREVLAEDRTDVKTLRELNKGVVRGARMLSYLRVSLIEQTRVLEGKPVPVELKPVSVRTIVETGASFQQQRFAHGHLLRIEGDDIRICADEMKMVTVLMNLIGNAFKYSDGEVCVRWETREDLLHLAVMDMGNNGRGIAQQQAERLFSPFARLEEHTQIEGTGLGLMSVRKIVQAHGGEVWLEGLVAGSPKSARFSTATSDSIGLLHSPFCTAFVLTCPLA